MSFDSHYEPLLIVKKSFLLSLGFDKVSCSDVVNFGDNPYWMHTLSDGSIQLGNKSNI